VAARERQNSSSSVTRDVAVFVFARFDKRVDRFGQRFAPRCVVLLNKMSSRAMPVWIGFIRTITLARRQRGRLRLARDGQRAR
jgi:bifunctional DNase/RNase